MRVTVLFVLFAVGIICFSGNAETARHTNTGRKPACERYPVPACPRILDPVCGTDQETYPNECELCTSNLRRGTHVDILRKGPC